MSVKCVLGRGVSGGKVAGKQAVQAKFPRMFQCREQCVFSKPLFQRTRIYLYAALPGWTCLVHFA